MSWSLIYEKKFPEVIAHYLLNHFLLEAISATPVLLFPSPIQMTQFLSFFIHGMLQMHCMCSITRLKQKFILLVKFCIPCIHRPVLLITLPLALHPQKHGTDVKSSLIPNLCCLSGPVSSLTYLKTFGFLLSFCLLDG